MLNLSQLNRSHEVSGFHNISETSGFRFNSVGIFNQYDARPVAREYNRDEMLCYSLQARLNHRFNEKALAIIAKSDEHWHRYFTPIHFTRRDPQRLPE